MSKQKLYDDTTIYYFDKCTILNNITVYYDYYIVDTMTIIF